MKRVSVGALCLMMAMALLLALLPGCNTPAGTQSVTSSPSAASPTQTATPAPAVPPIDTSKVDTYSFFTTGTSFSWDNPVAQEITKKTGVILKPDTAVSDPAQKLSLMAASGQYDDLIVNTDNATIDMMVKAHAYITLDDLIDQYGPDIKAFYGQYYSRLKYSLDDPSIYTFGCGTEMQAATMPGFYWGVCFWIQNDALKAQNYPKVASLDDYENVIKTYLQANPTTADGQKRLGITLPTSDGFRFIFSIIAPAIRAYGLPDNGEWYYDEANKTLSSIYTQQFMKDYMKWLNRIYNEGLIDPESFTQNFDTYQSKIAQGRVVGLIDAGWEMSGADNQLRTSGQGNLCYMAFDPLADPANMKWLGDQPGNLVYPGGFAITTSCKSPEKVVNFFNVLATEEGQILTEWGVEGVNYTVDANGQRVRNAQDVADDAEDATAYTLKTGVRLYTRDIADWMHMPYGSKTSNGQALYYTDTSNADAGFSQPEKDTLAAYNIKYFTDALPHAEDLPVRPYGGVSSAPSDAVSVNWQKISDMRMQNFAAAITCKPEEFDATWQKFVDALNADDIDAVAADVLRQFMDQQTLWELN